MQNTPPRKLINGRARQLGQTTCRIVGFPPFPRKENGYRKTCYIADFPSWNGVFRFPKIKCRKKTAIYLSLLVSPVLNF